MEEENKSFEELLNDSMNKKQKLDKIVEGKVIKMVSFLRMNIHSMRMLILLTSSSQAIASLQK